jgi:hypothetical protein
MVILQLFRPFENMENMDGISFTGNERQAQAEYAVTAIWPRALEGMGNEIHPYWALAIVPLLSEALRLEGASTARK